MRNRMYPLGASWLWDAALFAFAVPMYVIIGAARLGRHLRFLRLVSQPASLCRTCGRAVFLVGFWKCICGFTYRGHLLRLCPVCGTFPDVIRCEHCGATERVRR